MRVVITVHVTIMGIASIVQAQSAGLRPPPTYGSPLLIRLSINQC
jgi:hypothetical protein